MIEKKRADLVRVMVTAVPFFNTDNGMGYKEKVAKVAEMNKYCRSLVTKNLHPWSKRYEKIVASHLTHAAIHDMLDYPPEDRERELLKLADQLFNDETFRKKADDYLTQQQHLNLSSNSQSVRWSVKSTDPSLKGQIMQILLHIRENDVNYVETLTKADNVRIFCEKIVKRTWPHWPQKNQVYAAYTFLFKVLKTIFNNYSIEHIESRIQNWAKDLLNNSSFQTKVEHILKQREIKKRVSKLPFMKEENGLSCDQKLALITEIYTLTDKIIQTNWNIWPEGHHQFVSGTLVSNALHKLVDCTSKDRQDILLRWANELYGSSAFRREVDSFLEESTEHMPKKLKSERHK